MGLLPLRVIASLCFLPLSLSAGAPDDCARLLGVNTDESIRHILEDHDMGPKFIVDLRDYLNYSEEYLNQKTLDLNTVNWNQSKLLSHSPNWSEYIVHLSERPFQLKVYFTRFMRLRQSIDSNLQADIKQLMVQSALAEMGLARPVLGIVPPLNVARLGLELRRRGLLTESKAEQIYFAALYPYFDDWNTIVVPESRRWPLVIERLGRANIRVKIRSLERALWRLGIKHGAAGQYLVYSNGKVQLADFDHLRGPGFNLGPKH